ncbi:MAG: hypothetical protein ACSHYF_13550 [Verrucomicrobiaceae bacterium]
MKKTLLTVTTALIAKASAHPGPAGHTHPDEWPFEPVALLASLITVLLIARLVLRRS